MYLLLLERAGGKIGPRAGHATITDLAAVAEVEAHLLERAGGNGPRSGQAIITDVAGVAVVEADMLKLAREICSDAAAAEDPLMRS